MEVSIWRSRRGGKARAVSQCNHLSVTCRAQNQSHITQAQATNHTHKKKETLRAAIVVPATNWVYLSGIHLLHILLLPIDKKKNHGDSCSIRKYW